MPQLDSAEIDRRFDLHSPKTSDVSETLDNLRSVFKDLATIVVRRTPSGREQSLAVTALEESLYWAIGAIVRDQ